MIAKDRKMVPYPWMKTLLLCGLALVLSACQPIVRTDVATFRGDQATLPTGTIRVVPEKDVEDNLEFRHYKSQVESRLAAIGYSPTDAEDAEYTAELGYSVTREETDRPHGSRVVVGGGFYRYPRTSVYISNGTGAEYEYLREVSLAINSQDGAEPEQLVQVRATSRGQCEFLTVVFDEMLDAVFANIMRGDGTVEQVAVKGDARCRK